MIERDRTHLESEISSINDCFFFFFLFSFFLFFFSLLKARVIYFGVRT